ncbi:MAG: ethylbenzene dehydrogenase-related protein [Magnetococcus sp. DMHC-1]|nr:hypothetical protein [Magnetococcales bacterium]
MNGWNRALWLSALIAGMAGNATAAGTEAQAPAAPASAAIHYATAPTKIDPPPAGALQAIRVESKGPVLDPDANVWAQAKPVTVALQPQGVTEPTNNQPAVSAMTVRSVHNGHWLSLLLEWKDPTQSDRVVVDQFGDQVAVELPVRYRANAPVNPMMGAPGERVNIIQWRSAFQADLVRKRDINIRDIYPNAQTDLYPDQVLNTFDMRAYMGAGGVDNPVAKHRDNPVLDQVAEGFGTLTVKQHQEADGHGVWRDGAWHVVITVPMAPEATNSPRLEPGGQTVTAFAVWEGGAKEVGSRKSWSDWVPVSLAK